MILITGFGPFAGDPINPSELVAKELSGKAVNGKEIATLVLPVDTFKALPLLTRAIDSLKPELVISLGYASGRNCINIERVALNVLDFAIPDVAGNKPVGHPVINGGPASYLSTMPIYKVQERLRSEGIPCQISNNAGTYLCNQVMYIVLHRLAMHFPESMGGFIHVPALPQMDRALSGRIPFMTLDMMVKGIESAIAGCLAELHL